MPKKNPSKVQAFSVREFFARFPTSDACLEHVMEVRYGLRHTCAKCLNLSTFHRLAERPAYSCSHCGHHVYPCAGTIFQDTRTPLQSWFYAIYLFIATRHGVSGKEMQRSLGVTYKTAWRIGQQVRQLMMRADGFFALHGHVEIDEAFIGAPLTEKTIVMGMKERGGRLHTEIVQDAKGATLTAAVLRNVDVGSVISTDGAPAYGSLSDAGYVHGAVNHSARDYSHYDYRQDATHHTNSVESFWHIFRASVRGTHIHISRKYLDRYLGEFTFRSNYREMGNAMFDLLIGAV